MNMGDTHHAGGRLAAAREAWQQSLAILDELYHPGASRVRADQVRAKLDLLGANHARDKVGTPGS